MLKIKKGDDKPMVIHIKERNRLHIAKSKKMVIKGKNVLFRGEIPKVKHGSQQE